VSDRSYEQALQDFRRARQQAAMRQLLQRFTGRSNELLAYGEVGDKLRVTNTVERGLQEISLDAIVGSVGRAEDFTRDFLPKRDSDAERWARVRAAVLDMKGWSPIEVYKVGEVYFVKDGNHRVSVARQLGNTTISAHVTEIQTRLKLDAAADPADVLCQAYYLDFLERTRLDESRPEADLELTYCDQYDALLAQIAAHQGRIAEREGMLLSFTAAAARWYDEVYVPVRRLIRSQGTLRNFEERTEADLYVLLSERREEVEQALGWEVNPEAAVTHWVAALSERVPLLARLHGRVLDAVAPELEEGPPPGEWRRRRRISPRAETLFPDILVSLQGTAADWRLLEETIRVAQWEESRILALHAVDSETALAGADTVQIRDEFHRRCAAADVEGQFAAEVGFEGNLLIRRAAWADLVATNLTFATETKPLSRLSSGVDMLIRRCPRPILVLTGEEPAQMNHALLAYDGSPKADEALFVATYLALRWRVSLAVVTVLTDYTSHEALERARHYLLGHQLANVEYILRDKPIAGAVLDTAESLGSDLLIMGGFGYRSMRHLMLGSTVDAALRHFRKPILICR
jgi:nucleotide-binding universal stress UspA family protein